MHKNLISIDIGYNLTKVIEATLNKGVLEIFVLESFQTPRKDNAIDEKAFFESLFKIVPQTKFQSSDLAISVPSSAINFTVLELPKMPKDDLNKVVLREAKKKILPPPLDEDVFDYVILGEKKLKDSVQLDILAASGKKQEIAHILSIFKKEGIVPHIVSSTAIAMIAYFYEFKPDAQDNWAIIDVGFKNTNIIIFNKNNPALIRNIQFACSDFLEAAVKKTGFSMQKVEELFLREQLSEDVLMDSWQYLLSEIRRSFAYYKEVTKGQRIDSILFSGGLFNLKTSFEFAKKSMGGNLEPFSLSSTRQAFVEKFTPSDLSSKGAICATVLGLLFCLKPTKKALLNFLPQEVHREKRIKIIKFLSVQALTIIGLILLLFLLTMTMRSFALKRRTARLEGSFSSSEYTKFTEEATKIDASYSELRKQKKLVDKISKYQFYPEEIFRILSESAPKYVFLKKVSVGYQKDSGQKQGFDDLYGDSSSKSSKKKNVIEVDINAAVFGDYELAKEGLELFYSKLSTSGYFSELNLTPLKLERIIFKGTDRQGDVAEVKEREFKIQAKVKIK